MIPQEKNVLPASQIQIRHLAFNNGGVSERTCKVPAGKGLFIPVMQVELTEKDVPGATIEDVQVVLNPILLKISNTI